MALNTHFHQKPCWSAHTFVSRFLTCLVSLLVAFAKRGITIIIARRGFTKSIVFTVTLACNSLWFMCCRWVFEELWSYVCLYRFSLAIIIWQWKNYTRISLSDWAIDLVVSDLFTWASMKPQAINTQNTLATTCNTLETICKTTLCNLAWKKPHSFSSKMSRSSYC